MLSVYLIACLGSYDPTDPGPFNSVASDQVHNVGRLLGAWLANFFLFLTGYLAYSLPVLLVFIGWLVYSKSGRSVEKASGVEWLARFTGLLLFILSATGLANLHAYPPAGSMPAGGGGVGKTVTVNGSYSYTFRPVIRPLRSTRASNLAGDSSIAPLS